MHRQPVTLRLASGTLAQPQASGNCWHTRAAKALRKANGVGVAVGLCSCLQPDLPTYACQSMTSSPCTLENSATFRVTKAAPWRKAVAAMRVS